jgi:hypothetical protein
MNIELKAMQVAEPSASASEANIRDFLPPRMHSEERSGVNPLPGLRRAIEGMPG